MSLTTAAGVKLIGLPVNNQKEGELGTVVDVSAGEEGRVREIWCRLGWLTGERCLTPEDTEIMADAVVTTLSREDLLSFPADGSQGLLGVEVRSREGETLGKITNVAIEPAGFNIIGLELSNGPVRDWTRGRSIVILHPDEDLGSRHRGYIILNEEARTVSTKEKPDLAAAVAAEVPPIDWSRVRSLSEEEIGKEMAEIIWRRRGAPNGDSGPAKLMDEVAPWARELKQASQSGGESQFQDLALLSSDQVEALRAFRVGMQPLDRGKIGDVPEAPSPNSSGNSPRTEIVQRDLIQHA